MLVAREKFIDLALAILDNDDYYEDDLMIIRRNWNTFDLYVVRKPFIGPEYPEYLSTKQNILIIRDKEVVTYHSEHIHLIAHMRQVDLDKSPILW